MTTSRSQSFDWLKTVEKTLFKNGSLPARDAPDAFSWAEFVQRLRKQFEIKDLNISVETHQFAAGEPTQGIEAPWLSLSFALGELPGNAHWVIAENTLSELMASVLTGQPTPAGHYDKSFEEGFTRYIAYEVTYLLTGLGFQGPLAPRLVGQGTEVEGTLALGISLSVRGHTYYSRLILSDDLLKAWKKHFAQLARNQEIPAELAKKTQVDLQLEAGRAVVTFGEWDAIQKGDFLLLDRCTVIPGEDRGNLTLSVAGIPLFRALLTQEQIKILEYSEYQEVEAPMSAGTNEENHEEELSDFETEVEESEYPAEEAEEPAEATPEANEEIDGAQGAAKKAPVSALDSIPLTVVVEVGRLQITLAKLRDMQPGQLLDLQVKPEEGVDLVINGRCVARGELLRVGDVLGVRIHEIAH